MQRDEQIKERMMAWEPSEVQGDLRIKALWDIGLTPPQKFSQH